MSILDEIFAYKRLEVLNKMLERPLETLQEQVEALNKPPEFIAALQAGSNNEPALIAEIKHKSPSRGVLREPFDPLSLAGIYKKNGAAAISVLTDEKYFGGKLSHLEEINKVQALTVDPLPTLRKDFVFSEYQVAEAAAAGASAVLLIVAMLGREELENLISTSSKYHLTPLVEVHNREETEIAVASGAELIGINNRDLHSFSVDLGITLALCNHIPPSITVVSESGISSAEDVRTLKEAGVDAILVGETLVKAPDPGAAIRMLRGGE